MQPLRAPRVARAPGVAPRRRARTEPIAEGTSQVGRIGKPRSIGDFADRQALFEQAAGALESEQHAIAVGGHPERLLKTTNQMALGHLSFTCQVDQGE